MEKVNVDETNENTVIITIKEIRNASVIKSIGWFILDRLIDLGLAEYIGDATDKTVEPKKRRINMLKYFKTKRDIGKQIVTIKY